MLTDFLANHGTLGASIVVFLAILVGWLEKRVLGRIDIACVTWFFGVLVAATMPFTVASLGGVRWILGILVLVGGTGYLIWYFRRTAAQQRK